MDRLATVVIGFYGTTLDRGRGAARWERWRPTVALCQHPDRIIDRLELIHPPREAAGAAQVAADIAQISPETTVRLHPLALADPWDFEQVFAALHDFARAYAFDLDAERYLVHITTGTHVAQICWFLLAESRHLPAALIQTSPPRHGDRDVAGQVQIIDLDLSRYDALARRFEAEHAESLAFLKDGVDTRDPAFNRLIAELERVALRSREPILLQGPTGAGKSRLARRIHALKAQRRQVRGELIEVNCATIRGDAAASTLFGHVRGAYTGATHARAGLLRAADGGLLFLDEIGELGLEEQAMLLTAIEQRRFLPVGADAPVESEFQLIAGSNRDLAAAVRAGRFREDLLARIDLWTFHLPGLAERRADIEPNLDVELRRAGERVGRHVTLNREARDRFLAFATSPAAPWPAGFRELNAAILRMATLAPGGRIDVATVDAELARLRRSWRDPEDDGLATLLGPAADDLDPFDRVQLAHVVAVCRRQPSLSAAGRVLFAVSRTRRTAPNDADRLRKYLQRFGLSFDALRPDPPR
ncbi:MAG: sigma 54-interacting transcriptional regulator [Myxococcales bacterium]|nr:sigma 54-interacting transcriptional regulator [Myxococcales bacterium]